MKTYHHTVGPVTALLVEEADGAEQPTLTLINTSDESALRGVTRTHLDPTKIEEMAAALTGLHCILEGETPRYTKDYVAERETIEVRELGRDELHTITVTKAGPREPAEGQGGNACPSCGKAHAVTRCQSCGWSEEWRRL
jgi:hypothetical protein